MIEPIKKILFTTDLTEDAKQVFEHAIALANVMGAGIVILHVMEGTTHAVDNLLVNLIGPDKLDEIKERNKAQAHDALIAKSRDTRIIQEALGHMCDASTQGISQCRFSVEDVIIGEGHVAETVVKTAEEKGCGLIILGQYKRSLLEKGLVTSVVRGVLKRSPVPVMLVPIVKK
ncbi:MAG: universal stress protein [Thermodesulfobacteriota bacterium]